MSRQPIDDFSTPWENDGPGSLWTLGAISAPSPLGEAAPALRVVSGSGAGSPFARRVFTPALDLRAHDEIHLWIRSTRRGDGTAGRPFYLSAECYADDAMTLPAWQRLLPATGSGAWDFHELWLGDMPAALRQSTAVFLLRGLDTQVPYEAAVMRVLAARQEPVRDTDDALRRRLHLRFEVDVAGVPMPVPALIDVPENPGPRTLPYILISPWSVQLHRSMAGSGQVVDNYTPGGAAYRTTAGALQLEYRLDVFAAERPQKAALLDAILSDFARRPLLDVYSRPVECASFRPDDEIVLRAGGRSRTPLFYRITLPLELSDRVPAAAAVPFLRAEHRGSTSSAEVLPVQ